MKNRQFLILFLLIVVTAGQSCNPSNQKPEISAGDYEQAEQFLPENINQFVYNLRVDPHWINDTSLFWYDPFRTYSVATCLMQWGVILILVITFNKKLASLIKWDSK